MTSPEGRSLDARVAEILGWGQVAFDPEETPGSPAWGFAPDSPEVCREVPDFSTTDSGLGDMLRWAAAKGLGLSLGRPRPTIAHPNSSWWALLSDLPDGTGRAYWGTTLSEALAKAIVAWKERTA